MSSPIDGRSIVMALQQIGTPATLRQIVTHLRRSYDIGPNSRAVSSILATGVEYGYITKTRNRFFIEPEMLSAVESLGAAESELLKPTVGVSKSLNAIDETMAKLSDETVKSQARVTFADTKPGEAPAETFNTEPSKTSQISIKDIDLALKSLVDYYDKKSSEISAPTGASAPKESLKSATSVKRGIKRSGSDQSNETNDAKRRRLNSDSNEMCAYVSAVKVNAENGSDLESDKEIEQKSDTTVTSENTDGEGGSSATEIIEVSSSDSNGEI